MIRDRLQDYDDGDREHAGHSSAEGVPGKRTLTEHLQPPQLIAHSVGADGRNDPRDVATIQRALASAGHSPGRIDRIAGPRTIGAIKAFQRSVPTYPDGRVDVGGPTERRLVARRTLPRPKARPARPSAREADAPTSQRAATPSPASASQHAATPSPTSTPAPGQPTAGDPKGRIAALHPTLQAKARALLAEAQRRGLAVFISEGLRSMDRQNTLYAQGRTAPGEIVTWVRGGSSYHNYGLAIDVVFQGKQPWGEQHDWAALGVAGEAAGLEWGGRWKTADRPHFQIPGLTIAKLKAWHADGGMENVWRHVGGNRGSGGDNQPVAEDYANEPPSKSPPAAPRASAPVGSTNESQTASDDSPREPKPATKQPLGRDEERALVAVERFRPFIDEAAAKYGIGANQLKSIMAIESKGDPNATSGAAFGLMQITRGTWEHTRKHDPDLAHYSFSSHWQDPRINTLFGASVLRSKAAVMDVDTTDESFAVLAVTAYNAGENTVKLAMSLARQAGSQNPTKDFLRPEYLKPAIENYDLHSYYLTNPNGKRRNQTGTVAEAIELKYREITRYGPQVERYLGRLDGNEERAEPQRAEAGRAPIVEAVAHPAFAEIRKNLGSTISGSSFTWHEALWLPTWNRHVEPSDVTNESLDTILRNIERQAGALQKVRDHFGRKLVVHCWLRPPAYNAKVRGATRSAHLRGMATDFHIDGLSAEAVRRVLKAQHIYSGAGENNVRWLHLDLEHQRWFNP